MLAVITLHLSQSSQFEIRVA